MKRFASHFLFLPAYGYLKQYAIETEEGIVVRLFPLTEEIENVEWLPGAIVLLTQNELKEPDTIFSLTNASRNLLITPPSFIDGSCGLMPVYFPNFDTATYAACRRNSAQTTAVAMATFKDSEVSRSAG